MPFIQRPTPTCPDTALLFVIDFDGTLSTRDTVDSLLERFAPDHWHDLEEQWLSGQINAQQCMREQLRLVEGEPQHIEAFFQQIQLDPWFKPFLDHVQSFAQVAIVSDGLDHAIQVALANHGLTDLPVYANHLRFVAPNRLDLEFPLLEARCEVGNGVCKCKVAKGLLQGPEDLMVLVGDGKSDACLAHKADIVFAKNSLIRYCTDNGIAHIPFDHFGDVLAALKTMTLPTPAVSLA